MGNTLGRRRQVVDERYTRPQGLYSQGDVDKKKLRKLILDSKLAPCFPGDDDYSFDLEECPICFLFYPSLNRSRCCMKSICTECFLQMKPPHSTRPTQCPFCKTPNYAVEYRGVRTKEEKGMEQAEEQRVIEAKIRMRQQELQDEEERMHKRQETCYSNRTLTATGVEYQDVTSGSLSVPPVTSITQDNEIGFYQESVAAPVIRSPAYTRQNRDEEFELDLEDIMVMEAIWLSIQEHGTHRAPPIPTALPPPHSLSGYGPLPMEPSPTSGLACAIAALAEQQASGAGTTATTVIPSEREEGCLDHNNSNSYMAESSNSSGWIEVSPDSGRAMVHGAQAGGTWLPCPGEAEAGPSHGSGSMGPVSAWSPDPKAVLPESFEEQMMLAMAISLAEAHAGPSVACTDWHNAGRGRKEKTWATKGEERERW
ncbi:uncharacterized protein LOC18434900 isoform X2 [Amborella trichopoda]|uniref:uncharacterized protein LOC18434900 isoform X2 n=1 Tax=Amborella trichopoda TaxID=13333 RepID=UPI0005D40BDD|nr:uncharacterized protein LOC18434900 isoform X2 [Amborella trichopoda]|eukprot:XP_011623651.1 uncharacterized protein LOC18434900 isoform X2 [Amborella trichopoda]